MKKELSVDEIIAKHIEYDRIIEENLYGGDYKKNNRAVKNLNKLIFTYKDNETIASQVYDQLLSHSNRMVRANAAVECLRIGIFEEESLKILEDLAAGQGMLSFSCGMCLKLWRGEIKGKNFERY